MRSDSGRALALAMFAAAAHAAVAGPILVYREGPAFCPNDRPASAPRLTAAEAAERAKALMPKEFCGPDGWVDAQGRCGREGEAADGWVDGCDYAPEFALDSWRVYLRQWKRVDGRKQYEPREHSFVVLDPVGNCLANIPGT